MKSMFFLKIELSFFVVSLTCCFSMSLKSFKLFMKTKVYANTFYNIFLSWFLFFLPILFREATTVSYWKSCTFMTVARPWNVTNWRTCHQHLEGDFNFVIFSPGCGYMHLCILTWAVGYELYFKEWMTFLYLWYWRWYSVLKCCVNTHICIPLFKSLQSCWQLASVSSK